MDKLLYKLTKALVFYIPVLCCLITVVDTTSCFYGIYCNIFCYVGSQSMLTILFFWVASYTFKYCTHHRIPIYYLSSVLILNTIEYYFEIVDTLLYAYVFYIGTGLTILLYSYLKYKDNEKMHKLEETIKLQQKIIEQYG